MYMRLINNICKQRLYKHSLSGRLEGRLIGQLNSKLNGNLTSKQRGMAMFFAIIILLQSAVLLANITYRSTLTSSRTQNLIEANAIPLYGGAAESLAQAKLVQDFFTNDADDLSEAWAQPVQLPFEDGSLDGQVYGLQGCFNLNNLALPILDNNSNDGSATNNTGNANGTDDNITDSNDTDANSAEKLAAYQLQFQRILQHLLADIPNASFQQEAITAAITDWLDADSTETIPGGAEDITYSQQDAPYRAANTLFTSISELRLIRGITPEIYAALTAVDTNNHRALCVLPAQNTAINVNMAPPAVLASLHEDFSIADGQTLAENVPYASLNEFLEHELFDPEADENTLQNTNKNGNNGNNNDSSVGDEDSTSNTPAPRKQPEVAVRVTSSYYLGRATITIGDRTITLFSMLHRDGEGNVTIKQRSRGVF